MELSVILFVVALLIPGLCLIFIIGREFRQREWFKGQLRIEQELMARRAALRRISRRSAARPTGLAGEPSSARASGSAAAAAPALAGEAAYRDSGSMQGDMWQDLTASHLGIVFESFLSVIPEPLSNPITTSQVDEAFESFLSAIPQPRPNVITTSQLDQAFEKFLGEMSHGGLPV
jgi:hypothetical protein